MVTFCRNLNPITIRAEQLQNNTFCICYDIIMIIFCKNLNLFTIRAEQFQNDTFKGAPASKKKTQGSIFLLSLDRAELTNLHNQAHV